MIVHSIVAAVIGALAVICIYHAKELIEIRESLKEVKETILHASKDHTVTLKENLNKIQKDLCNHLELTTPKPKTPVKRALKPKIKVIKR